MNLLALDPGSKRVGIAISHGIMAEAFEVFKFDINDFDLFVTNLKKIINEQKIEKIIVGLPLGREGAKTDQTEFSEKFVRKLKEHISLPLEFVEESYSTSYARELGATKKDIDSRSAQIILEQYLNENN